MNVWRQPSRLRDGIVIVVSWCLVVTPFMAVLNAANADEIVDEANKGKDTGANLLLNYDQPSINNASPLSPLGPNEINIQELFPGYDPADPSQINDLSDLGNDPANLSTQGIARQFSLESGSDENAEAYQALEDGAFNPHAASIDLRSDEFLDRSRSIISGNDPLLDEILTACAEDVTAGEPAVDTVTRLEEVWTCSQRSIGEVATCTAERDYVLVPIETQVILAVVSTGCAIVNEEAETNVDLYNYLSTYDNSGEISPCRTERTLIDYSPAPGLSILDYEDRSFSFGIRVPIDAGDYDMTGYSTDACGTTPTDCEAAGASFEALCTSGSYTIFPGGGTPPGGVASYCASERAVFEANCRGTEVCGSVCERGGDINDNTGYVAYGSDPAPACWHVEPDTFNEMWTGGSPRSDAFIRIDNASAPGVPGYLAPKFCGEFGGSCTGGDLIRRHDFEDGVIPGGSPGSGSSAWRREPYPTIITESDGNSMLRIEATDADIFGDPTFASTTRARSQLTIGTFPAREGEAYTYNFTARLHPTNPPDGPSVLFQLFQYGDGSGAYGDTTDGSGPAVWIVLGDTGRLSLRNYYNSGSDFQQQTIGSMSPGETIEFEVSVVWSLSNAGRVEARMNGAVVATLSNQPTILSPLSYDNVQFHVGTYGDGAIGIVDFDDLEVWRGDAGTCTGGPTRDECNATAGRLEHICRNAPGRSTSGGSSGQLSSEYGVPGTCSSYSFDPQGRYDGTQPVDYTGCDDDRRTYCEGIRNEFACACGGIGNGAGSGTPILSGTETITGPGIGPGFPENSPEQTLFGETITFVENGFNPGDYGLIAGEYIIANHTISGEGVDSSSIIDGGSYGSNWDFTSQISLTDSPGFEVEATLYQIAANGFIFDGCNQEDIQRVTDGTCDGNVTCTSYSPPCRTVDGVTLCENPSHTFGITQTLSPWSDFTDGIPELCWAAEIEIIDCLGRTNCIDNPSCVNDCGDLPPELQPACEQDPCWVDAEGNTVCIDDTSEIWANNLGDTGFVDNCEDLLARPECTLLPEVTCVEGMEDDVNPGNIDLCSLRTRYFDCGDQEITVPGIAGADDVDVTCGAEVRCFGEECGNTQTESNPDFARAAVAATTVTESTKDMECDVEGNPTSCTLFEGTDSRCKDPRGSYLGIIPDCCKESRQAGASAGDFVTYMQLARYSFRLARDPIVASWLAQNELLPSGLQNVVNAPAQIGRSAGRVVVSGFNSALDWAGFDPIDIATESELQKTAIAGSPTGFGPIQQFIAGGVYDFLNSIGANEFATSLFTTTGEGEVTSWAADGLGEMVGNVFHVIGFIYTVYNILKILGSIFFACEEEELAFGIQQVNRACHHVGTYCSKKVRVLGFKKCIIETQTHCCFSSPFARIINEQLREQGIGGGWGSATRPNCDGIAISELENVDWGLVDLSEWEAILFEAGLVPDPRNPPLNFIPTDLHPGVAEGGPSGTTEGTPSTDLMQETINIVMPNLDEGRFGLDGAPLHQPDPELMPWYDDGG